MKLKLCGWIAPLLLMLTGCSLYSVPLPQLIDGPTYPISAEFESALNVPKEAPVKLAGAIVGQVTDVSAAGYHAVVKMNILESVRLPKSQKAEIRFNSPLGEAFVELIPVANPGLATLAAGDTIKLSQTKPAVDTQDLLASVSAVVTGGTFADLKVIVDELNVAFTGNSANVRSLISRLNQTMVRLAQHTNDFDRALSSVNQLMQALARDKKVIEIAIRRFQPALAAANQQMPKLLKLMASVRKLSRVSEYSLTRNRADLIKFVASMGPVLDTLTRNEKIWNPVFEGIGLFGKKNATATHGMYTNFDLLFELKLSDLDNFPGLRQSMREQQK